MKHYYLTPVLGGPGAPRYLVSEQPRLVGRSEQAEIALLEPTVSREHAAVQLRDGAVFLEDLGSKHGTFVNSRRISATKLKIGDIIVFGLSLVLRLEESDGPVVTTSAAPSRSTPACTLSAIEPLPSDRHAETQVTTLGIIEARSRGGQVLDGRVRDGQVCDGQVCDGEEIERLLDQLAKTRKLAVGGALCATTLPDIHQQLAQLTDLLEREPEVTPASVVEPLRQLQDELAGLLRLVHVPTPALLPTNLFDILRRAVAAVKPVAAPRQVDLLLGIAADVNVMADAARLEAAFVELLRNAAQISPEGHAVEIDADSRPRSVTVTVTNHGHAIPKHVIGRVFDPFFTLRGDRTAVGIGLFEARQLLLSMNAKLALESSGDETVATVILRRA